MEKSKLFILLTCLFIAATTACHGKEHFNNAQVKKTWLPGCITTETVKHNLLGNSEETEKSEDKHIIAYDNYGRLLYDKPSLQYYARYCVYEYDSPYTTIPHTTTWYCSSRDEKEWIYKGTLENEIIKNNDGKTIRINKYQITKNHDRVLCGHQSFSYGDDGKMNGYIYVNAENTDWYSKIVYSDMMWGEAIAEEPEVGSNAWRQWIVSPKSGLKSYTYTDTLVTTKDNVESKELLYKFEYTMDYGNNDYYWEEVARLWRKRNNLQVTSTKYTDGLGSHSINTLLYNGITDLKDRDENKLTYIYSQDTTYVTPNKYTVSHTSHDIKTGNILVSENSTYENTYNSEYGYLEKTHATGFEYTATEDKFNFEKTITYSDYRQYPITTDIAAIKNEADDDGDIVVSNLQGQRIANGTHRLPAGIYITKSGKIIVKK